MEKSKLSWKDVFNTDKKWYGHFSQATSSAVENGYEYFSWNGRVYPTWPSEGKGSIDGVCLVTDLLG